MKLKPSIVLLSLFLATFVNAQNIVFSDGDFDFEVLDYAPTEVRLKALDNSLKGDVIIPETATYKGETYTVTCIYNMGDNPDVTSIRIPKTVKSYERLNNLTGLQNIYVDENPTFKSIDGVLFSSNMQLIEYPRGRTGDYQVPEGTKRINTAFHSAISRLILPSSVEYVDPYTAYYVAEYEVVNNNGNYKSVNGALCSKDGKTLVAYPATNEPIITIPASVDSIGIYALQQSRKIIINSATPPSIGHYISNDYNYNISGIYVKSDYLVSFQNNAKTSKYNLFGFDVVADSLIFAKTANGEVSVVGSSKQSETIEIPQMIKDESDKSFVITSIGRTAFYQNNTLRKVRFPETLKSIGDSAFYDCYNLNEIALPASLKSIGKNAFYYCNLRYVYAECAPVDISSGCFSGYYGTLYVPSEYEVQYKSATGWSNFSTIITNDLIYDNYILKKITDESVSIIQYIGSQKDIVIPDEVTIDGKNYKVTVIGESAFSSKSLNTVALPKWLEEIGESAFSSNYDLVAIELPNSLKTINDYAFSGCRLASLTIPSSIEYIGEYVFTGSDLNSIKVEKDAPFLMGSYPFGWNSNIKILVKSSSVQDYKIAQAWQNYSENIYGVDAIVDDIAYQILDNQSVAVSCCMKTFGEEEYNRLTIPGQVNINNANYRVAVIAENTFNSIYYLNELTIPQTVDSIGSKAFNYNTIVRFENQIPPKINYQTFYNYPKKIIVPISALETYKTAELWKDLSDRIMAYDLLVDGVAYTLIDDTHAAVCGVLSMPENNIVEIPEKIESGESEYMVSVISSGAFNNTYGKLLVLPHTIDSIASNSNYSDFRMVYLKSENPPRLGSTNYSNVYVPSSAVESYLNNSQWVTSSYYENYIHGIDDIIFNDSGVCALYDANKTADLCFWQNESTDNIEIPASINYNGTQYTVTFLREDAFSNHYNIQTITIPKTITRIDNYALPSSSNMRVIVEADNPPTLGYHNNLSSQTLYVPSSAYEKYLSADGWKDFGSIVATDSGDDTFFYAKDGNGKAIVTGLKVATNSKVEIPEKVVIDGEELRVAQIGSKLFMDNYAIQEVKLPNTIEKIGDKAFYGSSLRQIMIPAYVEEIGERAFAVNTDRSTYTNLIKIQVRAGNEHFMDRNENLLLTKDGKKLLQATRYGGELSYWWGDDEEGNYGQHESNPLDGVEVIAEGALDGSQVSNLKLPRTLADADAKMLMYMPYLREINVDTLHQKLSSIDGVLFSKDTTTVIYCPYYKGSYYEDRNYGLPENVQNIGKFAFYNSQFESLTLSESLKTIADSAFYSTNYGCISSLILVNSEIAQASQTSFYDIMYQNTVLYVPMGTQSDYLNTSPWLNFRTINSTKLSDEDFQLLKAFYEEMGNGEGWYNQWKFGETADETRLTHGIRMIDEHVYSIDLSNNGLKGGLSDKLFKLPYLQALNLSNNRLSCPIDSVLNDVTIDNNVLQNLNISNNKFTGNIGSIANTLKNLTTLDASYNNLTQVSPMLPTSLYDLNLYHQEMGTFTYNMLYTADAEVVEANQPNLLYYNHQAQNYTSYHTYNLRNTDGDSWQMTLSSSEGNKNLYGASEDNWLYKRPNGALFSLSSNNNDNHSAIVNLQYTLGDVNFDTNVNVSDLQLTVNYAVEQKPRQLFNFTAADIQADDWVNVQDVVSIVNLLLDQNIDANMVRNARTRAMVDTEEEAEATLFWRGKYLILKSERDVNALDIAISNAKEVIWLLNDVDYDFSVSKKNGYIRIVHYSMAGKSIKAGETIIAEIDGNAANVLKAELVDKNAKTIKTFSSGTATAVQDITSSIDIKVNADVTGLNILADKPVSDLQWTVYSISGRLLGRGTSNLSSGSHSLKCDLAGETQVIIRLLSDHINITKKVSIIK